MKRLLFSHRIGMVLLATAFLQTSAALAAPKGTAAISQSQQTFQGQVLDEQGQTMPGVSVQVKGTLQGTTTDLDGRFRLQASEGAILVFSFMGYTPQEVVATAQQMQVRLLPDVQKLDEVVVIGYGAAKKENLSTAVGTLDGAAQIASRPLSNVQDMLQGTMAGVTIVQPGGDPSGKPQVVIRGMGSLNGESPLWVVDGMPYYGPAINPADIESMSVLKDASAAAIYGAQAASGVIVVTTKKGKAGKPSFQLDAYTGVQQAYQLPSPLDASGQSWAYNTADANDGRAGNPAHNAELNPWGAVTRTNWVDEIFRTGAIYNMSASLSGGNEHGKYATSFGYHKKDGLLLNTDYERFNFRLNTQYALGKRLMVGENLMVTHEDARGTNTSSSYSGAIINAIYMPSAAPVRDEDGRYHGVIPESLMPTFGNPYGDVYNPVALLERPTVSNPTLNLNGNIFAELNILEGLDFRSSFGLNLRRKSYKAFTPRIYEIGRKTDMNYLRQSEEQQNKWIWDNQITYARTFGKHGLNATAIYSAQYTQGSNWSAEGQNFDREDVWYQYLSNAKEFPTRPTGSGYEDALTSAIGRVMYDYDDRYFLSASVRHDRSSRLHPDNNADIFGAASAAWKISAEPWFQVPQVDLLKLRASWGQIGNIGSVHYYAYDVPLSQTNAYLGKEPTYINGSYINKPSNPDLQWERSETFGAGLDATLFKGQLDVTVDYFQKYTRGMIMALSPDPHQGISVGMDANVGTVANKGWEIALKHARQVGEFKYSIGANATFLHNELQDLDGLKSPFVNHTNDVRGVLRPLRSEVGQALYSYYLIPCDGIFQSQAEIEQYAKDGKLIQPNAKPGDLKFRDVNGDGKIDDKDREFMGSAMPTATFGLTLGAEYKGFDLSILLQGSYGNKIFNAYKYSAYNAGTGQGYNLDDAVLNAWTPENTDTDIPRLSRSDLNQNYGTASSWYLEDGSYLRVKNVTLGYNLQPAALRAIGMPTSQVRFYLSAENLFTFTGYEGMDPEVGNLGIDAGSYPMPRTFLLGLSATF